MGKLRRAFLTILQTFRILAAFTVIRFGPQDIQLHMTVKDLGFDILRSLGVTDFLNEFVGYPALDVIFVLVGAFVLYIIAREIWRTICRALIRKRPNLSCDRK